MHGIFGRVITNYTVTYVAYIRVWPTLKTGAHLEQILCYNIMLHYYATLLRYNIMLQYYATIICHNNMLQNYQKYYATILCYNIMPQYYATILCCNTMLQHRCSALFPCYETQRLMHSHLHAWNELYMLIHSHANEPCHVVIRFFDDLSDFMITHFATNCLLFLRIPVHKLHLIGRYILTHTHTRAHAFMRKPTHT